MHRRETLSPSGAQQAGANGDTARYRGARSRVALSDGQPRDPETEAPRTDSGFAPTGRKNLSPRLGVGRDYLRKTLREGDELATNSISAGEWRRAFTDLRLPVNHAPDDPPTFSLWPGLSGAAPPFWVPTCMLRQTGTPSIDHGFRGRNPLAACFTEAVCSGSIVASRPACPAGPPYWGAKASWIFFGLKSRVFSPTALRRSSLLSAIRRQKPISTTGSASTA